MSASKKEVGRKSRILIVDDHPMMREGLAHSINQEPDLLVCGETRNAAEALDSISKCKPDLVLTDITLPGKNGLELIKDIKVMFPGLKTLVISMHDESLYAERALRAGACGYITKREAREKMIGAIRHVLCGKIYASEKTAARIVEIFSGRSTPGEHAPVGRLSDREFEIFQLIGQGLATKEIGDRINISVKTVEAHRVNIKGKLGMETASELIAHAARWTAMHASGSDA